MKQALYRKPWPGLVAFTIAFLSQWVGHAGYTIIKVVGGDAYYLLALGTGLAGAALIFAGLKQSEIKGTWMGFVGALFVWLGWFEFTFVAYAQYFSMPTFMAAENLPSAPSSNMLQSTLPIMLALFVLYGLFNRQTKCNMMRWIHRNLRVDPGMPTPDNGRSFAYITALETLFVIWFCYLFWLYVVYFGRTPAAMGAAYLVWFAWFVYLFVKLVKIPRVGHAVRYGIPVGIIGWGLGEMPHYAGLYPEYWLLPFDYPVLNVMMLGVFIAGVAYVARQAPESQSASPA